MSHVIIIPCNRLEGEIFTDLLNGGESPRNWGGGRNWVGAKFLGHPAANSECVYYQLCIYKLNDQVTIRENYICIVQTINTYRNLDNK
jgi:hypothetical protein